MPLQGPVPERISPTPTLNWPVMTIGTTTSPKRPISTIPMVLQVKALVDAVFAIRSASLL